MANISTTPRKFRSACMRIRIMQDNIEFLKGKFMAFGEKNIIIPLKIDGAPLKNNNRLLKINNRLLKNDNHLLKINGFMPKNTICSRLNPDCQDYPNNMIKPIHTTLYQMPVILISRIYPISKNMPTDVKKKHFALNNPQIGVLTNGEWLVASGKTTKKASIYETTTSHLPPAAS